MTNPPTDTETIVRHFYAPLETGDTAILDEVLAEDWEALPALRSGPGREGWKTSVNHLRGVFSDLTVTIEDVVVAEDRAAVRTTSRGRHTGELLGVAGTGRPVEFRAVDVHQLSAGRIVRTWHLEDYFGIAQQLGLTFS